MNATFYILGTIFALMCVFLMLLILIQKGRGGGLSSAFGGAGGNTAFGTKTGDVLTWATSIGFALFLLLAMGLVWTGKALEANTAGGPAPTAAPDGEDAEGESSLPDAPMTSEPGVDPDADGTANDEPQDLNDVLQGESAPETTPAAVESIPADSE